MRHVLMIAALLACLLGGCASAPPHPAASNSLAAAPSPAPASAQVAATMRDILGEMDAAVAPEPSRDVTSGLYLAHITRVETANAPAFIVDFVTAQMRPGTTEAQRQASSWPDYFGWNRYAHAQRLSAAHASSLITGGLRFEPVSLAGFVREYASDPDASSLNYYVLVRDGGVEAVWPWQY